MNMICGLWAAYEVRLGGVLGRMCAGSGLPITLVGFKSYVLKSTRLTAMTLVMHLC